MFTIASRATDCGARRGTLHLAHGDVATPAFVPLATRGAVKTLEPRDLEALGYEMVLGNTFHLFLSPGHELVAELGGLHRFMGWQRPIITDSGGFQVFSMGHGSVADEIKGRVTGRRPRWGSQRRLDSRHRRGGGAVSLLPRRWRAFPGARDLDGGAGRAGLRHRARVRRVHAVSRYRDYTARSMERTHRWLRALSGLARRARARPSQAVYGIVQGGVERDLRATSAEDVAASACDGIAIGGSLGARQGPDVRGRVGRGRRGPLGTPGARGTCWGSARSTT